jgi:tetratricopeptide (TPR) repeat protein/predicted Ser/Thr protein kinase
MSATVFERVADLPRQLRNLEVARICADIDRELNRRVHELFEGDAMEGKFAGGGMAEFLRQAQADAKRDPSTAGSLGTSRLRGGSGSGSSRAYAASNVRTEAAGDEFELQPGTWINEFEIQRALGQGGMGMVYVARQKNPPREVALKVMKRGLDARALLRFDREAELAGRLLHPGIAQIYQSGVHVGRNGEPEVRFLAMELVRGNALSKHLSRTGTTARDKLALLALVADAVHYLHVKGVLHRDLKSSNILVDEHGQPKIIDFGIALPVDPKASANEPHELIGTTSHMAPERFDGEADARSDVYSLGIVASSLLRADPALRGDLALIVHKSLEEDPAQRYQSAEALAADIRRFLRHEPVAAHPSSWLYVLGKFVQRHLAMTLVSAAGLMALIAGVVGTSLESRRAFLERDAAILARSSEVEQRRAAEQNEQRALRQTSIAEATKQFMVNAVAAANPVTAGGRRDVSIAEFIDQSVIRLDRGELTDDPLVGAALRGAIASQYTTLARYADAEHQLRKVLEVHRAELAPTDPAIARTCVLLAQCIRHDQSNAEPEKLLEQAIEIYRSGGEVQQVGLLKAQSALALYYQMQPDKVRPILREALPLAARIPDCDDADFVGTVNDLANCLGYIGENAQAVPLHRRALALARRIFGDEHVRTATAMNNLANGLREVGNLDEAEILFRECVRIRKQLLNDGHPEIAGALNGLGRTLVARQDFLAAVAVYREALEIWRRSPDGPGPLIGMVEYNLGDTLMKAGRAAEESELLFLSAAARFRGAFGDRDLRLGHVLIGLGRLARDRGCLEDAKQYLYEALRIREGQTPSDDLVTAHARVSLAICLARESRFDEAESLLMAGYRSMTSLTPEPSIHVRQAIEGLCDLYRRRHRAEPASGWDGELSYWEDAARTTD